MKTTVMNLNILTPTSIDTQFEFLKRHYHKINANLLDVMCGNGYKTNFFENQGYIVTSIDKKKENTILFKENLNKECIISAYDSYMTNTKFDIIWVDDAFIYEKHDDILKYLQHFTNLLKENGFIYCSFKFGYDYYKNGQLYTCFTLLNFVEFIQELNLKVSDCLVTKDERPNRNDGWLHLLLSTK